MLEKALVPVSSRALRDGQPWVAHLGKWWLEVLPPAGYVNGREQVGGFVHFNLKVGIPRNPERER